MITYFVWSSYTAWLGLHLIVMPQNHGFKKVGAFCSLNLTGISCRWLRHWVQHIIIYQHNLHLSIRSWLLCQVWMFVQSNYGSGSGGKNERQRKIKLVLRDCHQIQPPHPPPPPPPIIKIASVSLSVGHIYHWWSFRSHTLRVACWEFCMSPSDPGEIKADGNTRKSFCIWAKIIYNTFSPFICKWRDHPVFFIEDLLFFYSFIHFVLLWLPGGNTS